MEETMVMEEEMAAETMVMEEEMAAEMRVSRPLLNGI
jgi:hypothetical protein